MKATIIAAVALTTVLAPGSSALARDRKPAKAAAASHEVDADADDSARVSGSGQTTEYIFDNDDVDGMVLRPEGVPVDSRMRARFPSLLSIRGHFVPELIRMAKDI